MTTRSAPPFILDMSQNTANSHRIRALAHHLPLGGSAPCSSYSSSSCSGYPSLFALQCKRGHSRRSYMPIGVYHSFSSSSLFSGYPLWWRADSVILDTRNSTNIALPLALSFLRDLRTAEYAYEAQHPMRDPFNQPPYPVLALWRLAALWTLGYSVTFLSSTYSSLAPSQNITLLYVELFLLLSTCCSVRFSLVTLL